MGKKTQGDYNDGMIYSVSGTVAQKSDRFVVIEAGGIGLKVATSGETVKALPAAGAQAKLFCHLRVREDALDLYGFSTEDELDFFELLISVSGVGPRSALAILDIANLDELAAAIKEGRPDLLARASGIGRRTAERIIVELKNKVESMKSGVVIEKMDTDADLVEVLTGLGYRREEARAALGKVDPATEGMELRLKAALAVLSKRK